MEKSQAATKTQQTQGAATTTPAKKDDFAGKTDSATQTGKPHLSSTLEHPTLALNKTGQKPASLVRRNSMDMAKFHQGAEEMLRTLNHQTHIEPTPHIKKQCDAINEKVPSAKVLHYIDQSQNPIMADPAVKAAFAEGSQGVCSHMTSQWIHMNESAPNQAAAVADFAVLVEHKFGNLVIGQHAEADMVKELKSLAADMKTEGATSKRLKAEFQTALNDKGPTSTEAQSLAGQLNASYDKQEAIFKKLTAVSDKMRRGEPVLEGNISELSSKLNSTTLENGYYRLSMTPKNGRSADGDESGHVVGMHKTDTTCRFMDANTAEWEVPNPADLNKLAVAHVDKMYTSSFFRSSGSGFDAGAFELRLVSKTP
ncbi:hypothetical protein NVS55_25035 [Myxococcus stipitatus]|uniref:hypothetical protein n=1 Tax=Myxococcus stipitatus TaxID=83455 RepID=UPI003144F8DD